MASFSAAPLAPRSTGLPVTTWIEENREPLGDYWFGRIDIAEIRRSAASRRLAP
jgi:hypothetical protein